MKNEKKMKKKIHSERRTKKSYVILASYVWIIRVTSCAVADLFNAGSSDRIHYVSSSGRVCGSCTCFERRSAGSSTVPAAVVYVAPTTVIWYIVTGPHWMHSTGADSWGDTGVGCATEPARGSWTSQFGEWVRVRTDVLDAVRTLLLPSDKVPPPGPRHSSVLHCLVSFFVSADLQGVDSLFVWVSQNCERRDEACSRIFSTGVLRARL